jgi:hypothetical protein
MNSKVPRSIRGLLEDWHPSNSGNLGIEMLALYAFKEIIMSAQCISRLVVEDLIAPKER